MKHFMFLATIVFSMTCYSQEAENDIPNFNMTYSEIPLIANNIVNQVEDNNQEINQEFSDNCQQAESMNDCYVDKKDSLDGMVSYYNKLSQEDESAEEYKQELIPLLPMCETDNSCPIALDRYDDSENNF